MFPPKLDPVFLRKLLCLTALVGMLAAGWVALKLINWRAKGVSLLSRTDHKNTAFLISRKPWSVLTRTRGVARLLLLGEVSGQFCQFFQAMTVSMPSYADSRPDV